MATKVSKLSLTGGKTLHPCRLNEDSNKVKLRPKQLIKKSCLVSRLSAVSITETVVSRQQQRPVSTGDILSCAGKNKKQLTLNNVNKNSSDAVAQLLHPDWRKIPWILYLGWTDAHKDLCKLLQSQVINVDNYTKLREGIFLLFLIYKTIIYDSIQNLPIAIGTQVVSFYSVAVAYAYLAYKY